MFDTFSTFFENTKSENLNSDFAFQVNVYNVHLHGSRLHFYSSYGPLMTR